MANDEGTGTFVPGERPAWASMLDDRLLDALRFGLPDCSGIAIGLDRLLMVLIGKSRIEEVLSFPFQRA